jgi:hypothetical protein
MRIISSLSLSRLGFDSTHLSQSVVISLSSPTGAIPDTIADTNRIRKPGGSCALTGLVHMCMRVCGGLACRQIRNGMDGAIDPLLFLRLLVFCLALRSFPSLRYLPV